MSTKKPTNSVKPKKVADFPSTPKIFYTSLTLDPKNVTGACLDDIELFKSIDELHASNVEQDVQNTYIHLYEVKYIGKIKPTSGYVIEKD